MIDVEAWKTYITEKIVPGIIFIVTTLLSIYLGVYPKLNSVQLASEKFKSATDDVNATNKRSEEYEKKMEALYSQYDEKMKKYESRLESIEKHAKNTEDIIRLGFGNITELVVKGYATEIAKVGKESEEGDRDEEAEG